MATRFELYYGPVANGTWVPAELVSGVNTVEPGSEDDFFEDSYFDPFYFD